jgi:hypothetical protein
MKTEEKKAPNNSAKENSDNKGDAADSKEPNKSRWEKRWERRQERWEHRGDRGGNITLAVFFIFIGLLFLTNNLGILPWLVWSEIWKFWPVFLILFGIQVLIGRSIIGRIVMTIVSVSVLLAVFWYILAAGGVLKGTQFERYTPFTWMNRGFSNQITTSEISIQADAFKNITSRVMSINTGVGKFTLQDQDDNNYFQLKSEYPQGFAKPEVTANENNGTLTIDAAMPGHGGFSGMPMMGNNLNYVGTIGRRDLATDIDIHLGAGETQAKFDTLALRTLSADVGVGSAAISLTEKSLPSDMIKLNVGVGSISLTLPKDTGVSVNYNIGLGQLSIDNQTLHGNGDYKTKNYDTAARKVQISTKAGTGSIDIKI